MKQILNVKNTLTELKKITTGAQQQTQPARRKKHQGTEEKRMKKSEEA
jgi:hypothetical protein